MKDEKIIKEICKIIFKIKGIEADEVLQNLDEPLTGSFFSFNGRDMVYLYAELCSLYKIAFTKDDVENYFFNYIGQIVNSITKKL